MTHPLVSVITPTVKDRIPFLERLDRIMQGQDYKHTEWLIDVDAERTIGAKRNWIIAQAKGSIILHMDDDDLYAPDWITKSVEFLQASNCELAGLSSAYFYQTANGKIYDYHQQANSQLFICGATMCYWRSAWEREPFKDISKGEDMYFTATHKSYPHSYKDGFLATVHKGNTSNGNSTNCKEMTPTDYKHPLLKLL